MGGDTNGDGSATTPAPGDWYGLLLMSGSETILDYVRVRYAGGYLFNINLDGWTEAQIEVKAGAQFTMTNSEVRAGGRMGIYLNGDGLTPTIESVTVADHTINDSHYYYAIRQSSINMQPTYANLTFSNNTRNEVTIGNFNGNLAQDVTLAGTTFGVTCSSNFCQLIVPQGRTLTVAPGTTLQFDRSIGIAIASGGTLRAEGTASQPIIFTRSPYLPSPPGWWLGLQAQYGSTLRLNYADISYATSISQYGQGGLEISTNDAQVRNTRIHHNLYDGLHLGSPSGATIAPVLTNVDVTDNGQYGVYVTASSGSVLNVTWDGGRVANNGWAGFYADTSDSSINPTLRNLTIANNGSRGTDRWKQPGIAWDEHNVSPVLENLTLTGNTGTAIFWYCNGSITARNLTATGNGANELTIPGCTVYSGRQWDLDGAGIPVRIAADITVAPNALLSLAPGTVLRFDKLWYNTDNTTRLVVNDQASLIALGTAAKPIILTAVNPTAGWWKGIEAQQRATVTLRHCEVAYGGGRTQASVYLWASVVGVPVMNIQNCEIHHSASRGVMVYFINSATVPTPHIFQYNHLHDTAEAAVANNGPVLDARNNYWGHASGPYHATQNRGGQGDDVGDNILFYPWLSSPQEGAVAGELMVVTGGPELVSPGKTVDYAVQYVNGSSEPVRNALIIVQLPRAAEYIASSHGGIYWPERDQVFWKLGDLPAGSSSVLSLQVRFVWGLPRDYRDGTMTIVTSDHYNPSGLDRNAYFAYRPVTRDTVTPLTSSQLNAQLAASPALQAAYNTAVAAGYTYQGAAYVSRSDGATVLGVVFGNRTQRAVRMLALYDGKVLTYTVTASEFRVEDGASGIRMDLLTRTAETWGTWSASASGGSLTLASGCTMSACIRNCVVKIVSWEFILKKSARIMSWTAFGFFSGGTGWLGTAYEVWDTVSTAKELVYDCPTACASDPATHCCTAGQVRYSGGLLSDLTSTCYREKCNAIGAWVPDQFEVCVAYGTRCVAGIGPGSGCVACEERAGIQQANIQTLAVQAATIERGQADLCASGRTRCSDLRLRVAKDPNDITGPAGDLLPGQTITYTIRYENEGDGRAYGVYVVNQLPDALDASTVTFVNRTGTYLQATRELVWTIGELGPKGAADSQGIITYTVRLREGLASGTVVANQAVVYFPSVPEETPTNTWVNLVAPLVATPQSLTTPYMTPLAITLSGREVSGLPLTYEVVEQPRGGTLSGTAPNLTYTPAADFTGTDGFTFRVSNGTSTSRSAQVTITVLPQGDTTAPRVLGSNIADGATGLTSTLIYTDTQGAAYGPVILVSVSELLDVTTLTTTTVTLTRDGTPVAASVGFDSGGYHIVVTPRSLLSNGVYRLSVTTGVKDRAGNALAAPYTTSFMIGTRRNVFVPLVLR
ncbi:right-handed parallel beta-helix repeat-containing protein [Chloroflexus sp.]|uniref:right-handed parallel beta-helix repeat-containing protein n=1 Tax=Chloroflexus sp. TaxID=1904827 RepID=UPI002ACE329C|nr:right-handed parallel beta-helix repeat-containing protein [Chloroflexus sp.]